VRFYIPPNLQRDFTDSLNALGTDAIVNFDPLNVIKVRLDKVNYKTINGTVTSDEVAFAEISSNLRMGDYLQYKGETLLINKLVSNEFPLCYEITTGTCNTKLTVTRYAEMVQDDDGNILVEAGDNPVVSNLYCSIIIGGFEFRMNTGGVGIVPKNQVNVTCQYNDDTINLVIGDKFMWMKQQYQITNLDYSQLDISELYGLLAFDAEKVVS